MAVLLTCDDAWKRLRESGQDSKICKFDDLQLDFDYSDFVIIGEIVSISDVCSSPRNPQLHGFRIQLRECIFERDHSALTQSPSVNSAISERSIVEAKVRFLGSKQQCNTLYAQLDAASDDADARVILRKFKVLAAAVHRRRLAVEGDGLPLVSAKLSDSDVWLVQENAEGEPAAEVPSTSAVVVMNRSSYAYKLLSELTPDSSKVNVYMVVVRVRQSMAIPNQGDPRAFWHSLRLDVTDSSFVDARNEYKTMQCYMSARAKDQLPIACKRGDILRLHRVKAQVFLNELDIRCEIGSAGSHCVLFDGRLNEDTKPLFTSSASFTFEQIDVDKITRLRRFIADQNLLSDALVPTTAASNDANAIPCSSSSSGVSIRTNNVANSSRVLSKQLRLSEIKIGGYFDLVAQIIGVFTCRESDRRILRVWDGTQPQYEITRTPYILESVPAGSYFAPLQEFLQRNWPKMIADIFVYDEHMPLCDTVKPGDVVRFRNLHSNRPKHAAPGTVEDTLAMHKDGARFNRGLTRLEQNHPESIKLMSELCTIFRAAASPEVHHFTNSLSPFKRPGSGQAVGGIGISGRIPILSVPQLTPPQHPVLGLADDQRPSASAFAHPLLPRQDSDAAGTNSTGPSSSPRRTVRFVSPQTSRNVLTISEQPAASSQQNNLAADVDHLVISIQPRAVNGASEAREMQKLAKAKENERKRKAAAAERRRKKKRRNDVVEEAEDSDDHVVIIHEGIDEYYPLATAEEENERDDDLSVVNHGIVEPFDRALAKEQHLRDGFKWLITVRNTPEDSTDNVADSISSDNLRRTRRCAAAASSGAAVNGRSEKSPNKNTTNLPQSESASTVNSPATSLPDEQTGVVTRGSATKTRASDAASPEKYALRPRPAETTGGLAEVPRQLESDESSSSEIEAESSSDEEYEVELVSSDDDVQSEASLARQEAKRKRKADSPISSSSSSSVQIIESDSEEGVVPLEPPRPKRVLRSAVAASSATTEDANDSSSSVQIIESDSEESDAGNERSEQNTSLSRAEASPRRSGRISAGHTADPILAKKASAVIATISIAAVERSPPAEERRRSESSEVDQRQTRSGRTSAGLTAGCTSAKKAAPAEKGVSSGAIESSPPVEQRGGSVRPDVEYSQTVPFEQPRPKRVLRSAVAASSAASDDANTRSSPTSAGHTTGPISAKAAVRAENEVASAAVESSPPAKQRRRSQSSEIHHSPMRSDPTSAGSISAKKAAPAENEVEGSPSAEQRSGSVRPDVEYSQTVPVARPRPKRALRTAVAASSAASNDANASSSAASPFDVDPARPRPKRVLRTATPASFDYAATARRSKKWDVLSKAMQDLALRRFPRQPSRLISGEACVALLKRPPPLSKLKLLRRQNRPRADVERSQEVPRELPRPQRVLRSAGAGGQAKQGEGPSVATTTTAAAAMPTSATSRVNMESARTRAKANRRPKRIEDGGTSEAALRWKAPRALRYGSIQRRVKALRASQRLARGK